MPDTRRILPLTTTEYALLGMLARYGESSGYALLRQAKEGIGFFWSPAKSHVYDVLPRLEQHGLAHRRIVPQQGKPDKHLWRLTRQGRTRLRRWLSAPEPDPFGDLSLLLLKLFFGDHGDPDSLVSTVERYRDQAIAHLNELRRIETEAVFQAPEELPRLALQLGLSSVQAHLAWAQMILPRLNARAEEQRHSRSDHSSSLAR